MIEISQIRDAAAACVLRDNPHLSGLVTFDASVPSVWPGMAMIELRVYAAMSRSILELARERDPSHTEMCPLAVLLRDYTVTPDGYGVFELDGYRWFIGDGDDSLAVRDIDPRTATLWVRTWWEAA